MDPIPGYELSLGTTLAKVGRLGAENCYHIISYNVESYNRIITLCNYLI